MLNFHPDKGKGPFSLALSPFSHQSETNQPLQKLYFETKSRTGRKEGPAFSLLLAFIGTPDQREASLRFRCRSIGLAHQIPNQYTTREHVSERVPTALHLCVGHNDRISTARMWTTSIKQACIKSSHVVSILISLKTGCMFWLWSSSRISWSNFTPLTKEGRESIHPASFHRAIFVSLSWRGPKMRNVLGCDR